jgi:hypothetical protein
MATRVSAKPQIQYEMSNVSDLVRTAVKRAAARQGKTFEDWRQEMQSGDCQACGDIRYPLAQGLAEYLGALDTSVKAVYVYEPEYATSFDDVAANGGSARGMNLIVWATRNSAALTALVASVGEELGKHTQPLSCPEANALCWSLDVQIVDDEQVEKRSGYGALIDSMYVRPMEVWRR